MGTQFTIYTDYKALGRILNLTDSTGELAHKGLRLPKFDFDVAHRAGAKHQAGNAPSRLLTTRKVESPLKDKLPLNEINANSDSTNILVIYASSEDIIPLVRIKKINQCIPHDIRTDNRTSA